MVRKKEGAAEEAGRLLHAGKDYVVYGILLKPSPKFLIYEPDSFSFPLFVESETVEVIDSRLSNYWLYSPALASTELYSSSPPLISFEAMVHDRLFYQALVDGRRDAVAAWETAKRLIDFEARGWRGTSDQ